MLILLVLTGHRQLEEYKLFSNILKQKCPRLCKESDLVIHCNYAEISNQIQDYFKDFPQQNKKLFITTKNVGYRSGGFEAVSDLYDMNFFKEYDYVIHLHPDVFITNEDMIWNHIEANATNNIEVLATKCLPHFGNHYAFDFFILKPKLLKTNIFSCWNTMTDFPERVFYEQCVKYEINVTEIPRYFNNDWSPRRIDEFLGLWHEHDLEKVRNYILELEKSET